MFHPLRSYQRLLMVATASSAGQDRSSSRSVMFVNADRRAHRLFAVQADQPGCGTRRMSLANSSVGPFRRIAARVSNVNRRSAFWRVSPGDREKRGFRPPSVSQVVGERVTAAVRVRLQREPGEHLSVGRRPGVRSYTKRIQ